jgi:hypothetical protein
MDEVMSGLAECYDMRTCRSYMEHYMGDYAEAMGEGDHDEGEHYKWEENPLSWAVNAAKEAGLDSATAFDKNEVISFIINWMYDNFGAASDTPDSVYDMYATMFQQIDAGSFDEFVEGLKGLMEKLNGKGEEEFNMVDFILDGME